MNKELPRLSDPIPGLSEKGLATFLQTLDLLTNEPERVTRLLGHIDRIIDVSAVKRVAVVGCGPKPEIISLLRARGMDAFGVEPVPLFVQAACKYLNDENGAVLGAAERLPLADEECDLVFFENVLEHVESPRRCLVEIYRVLKPGGLVYLTTTNRHRFSLSGNNDEYSTPFLNWFPRTVREGYVHNQLHFDPALANDTERPAVHWFTFAELVALGRDAEFARFYSTLDTRLPNTALVSRNPLRRWVQSSGWLLRTIQRSPWLRAMALSQMPGDIMMWKRKL
ncbi:MAG: class I SAM-dependent methyltransferase [Gemmatimonadota bacterium]